MSLSSIKNIAVLGCTGSIGRQTLDIVERLPDRLKVVALAAGSNWSELVQQAVHFSVKAAALVNSPSSDFLNNLLPEDIEKLYGTSSLEDISGRDDVDIVVVAVAGAIGIRATVKALLAGKTVALATKEVLVAAGEIVYNAARSGGGTLVPIDSEHSGVMQCLAGSRPDTVSKVWLTASGGPFRLWTADQIRTATVADALKHPTWSMGKKITIDSATMMNKGLETIEATWLFNIDIDQVGVVVHPQSTVHALVQFQDGAIIAQLGNADMRLPIEYALLFPQRVDAGLPALNILDIGQLDFSPPDETRFPCLRLARQAAKIGGTAPAVLNAANEAAVAEFLSERISFVGIAEAVERTLEYHTVIERPDLEQILSADKWAREFVSEATLV